MMAGKRIVPAAGLLLALAAAAAAAGPEEEADPFEALNVAEADKPLVEAISSLPPMPRYITGGGNFWVSSSSDLRHVYDTMIYWKLPLDENTPPPKAVVALRAGSERSARLIEQVMPKLPPADPRQATMAMLLGELGDARSLPVLVDLMERQAKASPAAMMQVVDGRGTLWALWQLTGRRVCPKDTGEWKAYAKAVKDDFVPARLRAMHRADPKRIAAAIAQVGDETHPYAADRLIVMGPTVVEPVLAALKDAPEGSGRQAGLQLVLEHAGGLDRLSVDRQRAHYVARLGVVKINIPDGRDTLLRAARALEFADFCRVAIAAERQREARGDDDLLWGWMKGDSWTLFEEKAKASPKGFADASDVLIAALRDESLAVRRVATEIIDAATVKWDQNPEPIFTALEAAWRKEANRWLQSEMATPLARRMTPQLANIVEKGLWDENPGILRDCIAMCATALRRRPEILAVYRKVDPDGHLRARLLARVRELTRHESDDIRGRAIRTIRTTQGEAILDDLAELAGDSHPEVRQEVAIIIQQSTGRDEEHAAILARLLKDENPRVRDWAFNATHNRKLPALAGPLVRWIGDPEEMYKARIGLEAIGGELAIAGIITAAAAGNDIGDTLDKSLQKLTEQRRKGCAAWVDWWWQYELETAPVERDRADAAMTDPRFAKLWEDLGSEPGLAEYAALRALASYGDDVVRMIAAKLPPVAATQADVEALIAALSSEAFADRRDAYRKLTRIRDAIVPDLREALKDERLGQEARQRLKDLVEAATTLRPADADERRGLRAVRVLEVIATPAAQDHLETLSGGAAGARLTEAARRSLKRLKPAAPALR